MKNSEILITASTGNIGAPLSKALNKKNIPFTAATRNAKQASETLGFKPDTVYLDYRDPSGFAEAIKGVKTLFLCGPSATPGAEKLLKPIIEEANKQEVKHVVFIASYPDIMDYIEKSDMNHTFLRANFFMQNFEMYQTEDIRDKNQIFFPTGEGKAPFIHCRDIGEVAAEVIQNLEIYAGETLYLTGPELLDHNEVADIFSEVLDRKITYTNPDDDTYRKEMKDRGFSSEYIEAMIAVFGKIKKGSVAKKSDMVEKVLGRKPLNLRDYIEENRDVFTK
ncbi:MAG: NmrA family NAD(P)-binding protein [Bacteroidales bacterium]